VVSGENLVPSATLRRAAKQRGRGVVTAKVARGIQKRHGRTWNPRLTLDGNTAGVKLRDRLLQERSLCVS